MPGVWPPFALPPMCARCDLLPARRPKKTSLLITHAFFISSCDFPLPFWCPPDSSCWCGLLWWLTGLHATPCSHAQNVSILPQEGSVTPCIPQRRRSWGRPHRLRHHPSATSSFTSFPWTTLSRGACRATKRRAALRCPRACLHVSGRTSSPSTFFVSCRHAAFFSFFKLSFFSREMDTSVNNNNNTCHQVA
jgi:hypothetical protein